MGYEKELSLGNIESKRDWGFAPDYVEAMWMILQQEKPRDYVLSTGETHSVGEFVEEAFKEAGLDWTKYVKINEKLKRPKDVIYLKGDSRKAREILNWKPKVDFKELVRRMTRADLRRWEDFRNGKSFPWDAFNYPEKIDILQREKRPSDKW